MIVSIFFNCSSSIFSIRCTLTTCRDDRGRTAGGTNLAQRLDGLSGQNLRRRLADALCTLRLDAALDLADLLLQLGDLPTKLFDLLLANSVLFFDALNLAFLVAVLLVHVAGNGLDAGDLVLAETQLFLNVRVQEQLAVERLPEVIPFSGLSLNELKRIAGRGGLCRIGTGHAE